MTDIFANWIAHNALRVKAALCVAMLSCVAVAAFADKPTMASVTAIPPLVASESTGDLPNILLVLDNSNSMDETPTGLAVDSASPESRSMIARRAVNNLLDNMQDRVRMGLMAYKQESVSKRFISAAFYDVSYESGNYDPTFTGDRASLTKRFQSPSPEGNVTSFYNISLPLYSNASLGEFYCYSRTAEFDNGSEHPDSGPWDSYRCFRNKDSATDELPKDQADESSKGFKSFYFQTTFQPTDSDIARNILDFGRHISFLPVGDTWFSNVSPGSGMLHEPIRKLDAEQRSKLSSWLQAPSFDSSDSAVIRNAGLTPLQGTLISAREYFQGSLSGSNYAGGSSVPAVPVNDCGNQEFVILITDGLPSVDKDGKRISDPEQALQDVAAEAAKLAGQGILTYVIGFALPVGSDSASLNIIAEAGGTLRAYAAEDEEQLTNVLIGISEDVLNRSSSSSAASVVSNSSLGVGAVFQALYRPLFRMGDDEVRWGGIVHGLFIDERGRLREDTTGNQSLSSSLAVDREVVLFFDEVANRTRFRRYSENASGERVLEGIFELEDLKPIWDAREHLASLGDDVLEQRPYGSNATAGRYIFTHIDAAKNGLVDSGDVIPFTAASVAESPRFQRYLDVQGKPYTPEDLVNFIRGKEGLPGFRNRTVDFQRKGTPQAWLLGDIVHSSPLVVGAPQARFDILHQDDSYRAFRQQYENRRQVLYVGANDGMLHAFNVGFYDLTAQQYKTSREGSQAVAHPLGAELWAFVPQAALPHLKWLADPNYTHVYYVDGPPKSFDVNIFPASATHPHGWGTILVVPMRFGGADYPVDSTGDGVADHSLRSSILVFDITDPEQLPRLLAEFSHPDMGYTTSQPTVVKRRGQRIGSDGLPAGTFVGTGENHWYLVAGSGPNGAQALTQGISEQLPKLFVFDLKTMAPASSGSVLVADDSAAFVGDLIAQDWTSNYRDDVVYFGTVSGTPEEPGGDLKRMVLSWEGGLGAQVNNLLNPCGDNIVADLVCGVVTTIDILGEETLCNSLPLLGLICETVTTIVDTITSSAGLPFQHAPQVTRDAVGNGWVFAGSGRFLVAGDNQNNTQQFMFGIKEPLNTAADATHPFSYQSVSRGALVDTSGIQVFSSGKILNAPLLDGITALSFAELLGQMQNKPGWYTKLSTSTAKNAGQAQLLGNILLYNEYVPSTLACVPEGEGFLNAVDFRTGTATSFGALGFGSQDVLGMGFLSLKSVSLGRGMPSVPVIHQGKEGATVISTTSTGSIETSRLHSAPFSTGRQSWREIRLD